MEDTVFKTQDGWRLLKEGEREKLALENRVNFFAALEHTGVVSVRVTYSGSLGDDQIDGIEFLDKDVEPVKGLGKMFVNTFKHMGERVNRTPENPEGEYKSGDFTKRTECGMEEAADLIASNEINTKYYHWYKDEGGDGEFEFFVADERIEWEHRKYFTDFETYQHTLEIKGK